MENRFEAFTSYISLIYKNIQKLKDIEMNEFGLKSVHVMCIYYLGRYNDIGNSDLVKLTNEDKAAISRALSFLDVNGYIECNKKYKSAITLLPKGKEVYDYIDKASNDILAFAGNDFKESDRIMFYEMLKVISNNLDLYIKKLEK